MLLNHFLQHYFFRNVPMICCSNTFFVHGPRNLPAILWIFVAILVYISPQWHFRYKYREIQEQHDIPLLLSGSAMQCWLIHKKRGVKMPKCVVLISIHRMMIRQWERGTRMTLFKGDLRLQFKNFFVQWNLPGEIISRCRAREGNNPYWAICFVYGGPNLKQLILLCWPNIRV